MSSIFFKKNFPLDKASVTPSGTPTFIINPLDVKNTRNFFPKEIVGRSLRRLEYEV